MKPGSCASDILLSGAGRVTLLVPYPAGALGAISQLVGYWHSHLCSQAIRKTRTLDCRLFLYSYPPNLIGVSVYLPCSPLQGSAPASSFPPFPPSAQYSGTRKLLFSLLLLSFLRPDVFHTQKPKGQHLCLLLCCSRKCIESLHCEITVETLPHSADPGEDTTASQLSLSWLEPHLLCSI